MQRRILAAILYLLVGSAACQSRPEPLAAVVPQPTSKPTNQTTNHPTPQPTSHPTIQPTDQPSATPSPFTPPDILYLAAVEQTLADFDGVSSYVVVDLETGGRIARDEDVAIAGMSLLKIPILVETYRVLDRPPDVEQTKLITQTTALSSTYLTPANQRTDLTTHADPYRQTTIGNLAQLLQRCSFPSFHLSLSSPTPGRYHRHPISPTNQPTNRPIDHPTIRPSDQSTNHPLNSQDPRSTPPPGRHLIT